jgi:hypothetical protein
MVEKSHKNSFHRHVASLDLLRFVKPRRFQPCESVFFSTMFEISSSLWSISSENKRHPIDHRNSRPLLFSFLFMSTAFWTLVPAKSLDDLPLEAVPGPLRPAFDDLMIQADFLDATTMRDQAWFSCVFLHPPGSAKKVSYGNIAFFFHVNKESVVNYWNRHRAIPRPPQRPRGLPDQALSYIMERVQLHFTNKMPVFYRMLLDGIELNFGISLRADTVRHIC